MTPPRHQRRAEITAVPAPSRPRPVDSAARTTSSAPHDALTGAACREPGVDPDWFFPDEHHRLTAELALQVCARCPVRNACLQRALHAGERFGIWGGMTAGQRTRLRKEQEKGDAA